MLPLVTRFKALADATRLRILDVLRLASFNVGELCAILDMGQSRISRHLRILQEADLLRSRRDGTWIYYALPRPSPEADENLSRGLLDLLARQAESHPEDRARALETLQLRASRSRQFFEEVVPRWDEVRRRIQGDADHMEELLRLIPRSDLLVELGSGTGEFLLDLAERSEKLIGIDRSPRMIAEAERRRDEARVGNVEYRLGTLEHLPLRDGEAQTAVANMVLHYVADPALVLREVHRALRPGGTLLIADLTHHSEEWMREELNHQWLGFEPEDLMSWLRESGFHEVQTRTISPRGEGPDVLLASGRR